MKINLDKLRPLVSFDFTPEHEDQSPEDHFDNQANIDEARSDYSPHPGWFCSKVVASFAGIESYPQYLGCCSYATYEDYTSEERGYYMDQCEEALADLAAQLQETLDSLLPLVG